MIKEKIGQVFINEIIISLANDGLFLCPKKSATALIAAQVNTIRIFQPYQVGNCIDQYLELGLGLSKFSVAYVVMFETTNSSSS